MPHLDVGVIHELLDGEISSEKLPPIQAHLSGCAACRALLDEEQAMLAESDELIESLEEVAAPLPGSALVMPLAPRRAAQWPRQLAWAASLVLAVGLGYTARGGITPPIGPTVDREASATDAVQVEEALPTATTAESEAQAAPARSPDPSAPSRERDQSANRLSGEAAPPAETPVAAGAGRQDQPRPVARSRTVAGVAADAFEAEGRAEPAAALQSVDEARRAQFADADDLAAGAAPAAAKALGARDEARALDSIGVPAGALWRLGSGEPTRTEYVGDEVRLVYLHPMGEVILVQRRVGAAMGWRIEVPAGFPADSLAALRGRVR